MSDKPALKSVTTKNGKLETTISVREITNGWIVRTYTSGEDSKGKWISEEKEEYSETNPLDPTMMKLDIIKEALGKKK